MAKFITIGEAENHPNYIFICPGCGSQHEIFTSKPNRLGAIWQLDGSVDSPTITPEVDSCLTNNGEIIYRCHFTLAKGKITFMDDCTHEKAGKTLTLPDIATAEPSV